MFLVLVGMMWKLLVLLLAACLVGGVLHAYAADVSNNALNDSFQIRKL